MATSELVCDDRTVSCGHLGDAGPHQGHHLHSDLKGNAHCLECGEVLTADDTALAWPVDSK